MRDLLIGEQIRAMALELDVYELISEDEYHSSSCRRVAYQSESPAIHFKSLLPGSEGTCYRECPDAPWLDYTVIYRCFRHVVTC